MKKINVTKTFLFCCTLLILLSGQINQVFAQQIFLKFNNAKIQTVLAEIESKTGYSFVYSDALNFTNKNVTIEINAKSIEKVLEQIFDPNEVVYLIKGKQIILTPKQLVPVKYIQIKGSIKDKTGQALIGVSIYSSDSKFGTSTNFKGDFNLQIPESIKVLNVSYIGYVSQQINITTKGIYSIILEEDVKFLDEVVVTGYQTLSKERATGSFGQVKGEQLNKPSSSLIERIIGTTAGVQNSLDRDGNIVFEIRGQTSLNVDNARPLIVVDGFAIQGDFSSINPNDVESVTILKDAAAASIWGAKSANGVIVVTTKKGGKNGSKGGARVEVSSFIKVASKIDYDYYNPSASSADVVDYEKKGYLSQYFGGPWSWADNLYTNASGAMSKVAMLMNENRLGFLSTQEMNAGLSKLSTLNNREQIKKYLLQNPFTQQYNINISGSTERMNNVLSIMAEGVNQNLEGSKTSKYMVNYRTSIALYKWLDFNFSGMFQYSKEKSKQSSLPLLTPYEMLINEDGSYAQVNSGFNLPILNRTVPTQLFPYSDWTYNPILEKDCNDFTTKRLNTRIQGGLTFKIIKGLTFDSKIQYERADISIDKILDEKSFSVRRTVNTTSSWDRTLSKITPNLPKGGFRDMSKTEIEGYNFRNQMNFDRTIDKHQISVVVGTEISDKVSKGTSYPRTYGYNDTKLTVGLFPNGPKDTKDWMGSNQTFYYTNSFSYATDRYFSLYGNAAYTFNNKYTLTGSIRTDASNLITEDPKYRYAPFWSVGFSWQTKKEKFLKSVQWIDKMNLRLTYGYNGNVDRSTSFRPLISIGGTENQYIQDYTASIASFGNPYLRWEKTGTWDLGLDFSVLKSRLWGKIDLYQKNGKDLITSVAIPSVHGTTSQKLNTAKMVNKGIELEIGSALPITSDRKINWTGSLNFSYNYNSITDLFKVTYGAYELYAGGSSAYVQGYNSNTMWAFKYAGVKNMGTESAPNMQPMVQGKGDQLYGFGAWTPGDGRDYMLNMGTKVAPYTLGFSSMFNIYDFDFSFIVTGKFGHVFNRESFNYPSMSNGSAVPNDRYQEVLNGDPMKVVPIPFDKKEERYYFWDRFYPYLSYLVEDASHVRLQEVNLSYNMPKRILNKIGFNSMKIFAQGNNLFTIVANKSGEDPEYPKGTIKPTATYTFGVKFDF